MADKKMEVDRKQNRSFFRDLFNSRKRENEDEAMGRLIEKSEKKEIKSRNQQIISSAALETLDHVDIEKQGSTIRLLSQDVGAELYLENGKKLKTSIGIVGEIRRFRAELSEGSVRLYLLNDLGEEIGSRTYQVNISLDDETCLEFSGKVVVGDHYGDIGIGSALMGMDEDVWKSIVRIYKMERDIHSIKIEIVDSTSGANTGWTDRKYRDNPDWHKSPDGVYSRTIVLD